MHSSLKAPTKAEQHRLAWMKMDGCIACRKRGNMRYADVHHILEGGRRVSHSHSIPLCEWHHRGINVFSERGDAQLLSMLGPSLAHDKKAFTAEFGTEQELLKETDDRYMEGQIDVS